ncbi:MAG: glycoside hydrolase family 13 protein [Chloroflexota bacterium]
MNITTPEWVRDAIFYQIFPDRFAQSTRFGKNGYPPKPHNLQPWGETPTVHGFQGGDLLGVIEKLDYLQDLGVNALYLNPIFSSASNHRYHTFDYYTVDPILGGNKAFDEFLNAAHQRGFKVVLDGVFNHASRGFFQFNHLMECGAESPYTDWFHVHDWPINAFNEDEKPNYYAWWGMHSLPKFNTSTPAVREFLWEIATYWLEKGIDGWRLDVPNEIDDDAFWQEFRKRCKVINPDMYITGELWGEAHRWLQGDQFDGQMNYMFTRAALGYFSGDNMDQSDTHRCGYGHMRSLNGHEFAEEVDRIFTRLYHPDIVLSNMNMLGSHDTPRTATIARNDLIALKQMFLFQMTSPGIPNIYYGDEIGLLGAHDPYCRGAFPWDDSKWNHELRQFIKKLISLRKKHAVLRRGAFKIIHATYRSVFYKRVLGEKTAVIAFNSSQEAEQFDGFSDLPDALINQLDSSEPPLKANQPLTILPKSWQLWINE